jgi:hypothetical protein
MPKINEMYAFVSEDNGPDDEGVVAQKFGDVWLPMVGANMDRAEALKSLARIAVKATGKTIKLLRFTNREELEIIEPKP